MDNNSDSESSQQVPPEFSKSQPPPNASARIKDFLEHLQKNERIHHRGVLKNVITQYVQLRQFIPGAPELWDLSSEDTGAVVHCGTFDDELHRDWIDFKSKNFFSPAFMKIFRATGLLKTNRGGQAFLDNYLTLYQSIPGAPQPGQLGENDLFVVIDIGSFNLESDNDWGGLSARIAAEVQIERDTIDIFLETWEGKTEVSMFGQDTGQISQQAKEELRNVLRDSAPERFGRNSERLSKLPSSPEIVDAVVTAMMNFLDFFTFDMGEVNNLNEDFCRAKSVAFLSGLGLEFLRKFAHEILRSDDRESAWMHYEGCTQKELVESIIEMRGLSGYPPALIRAPFPAIQRLLKEENLPKAPAWYKATMLLHILKHTTFYRDLDGENSYVFIGYMGNTELVPLDDKGLTQSLDAMVNQAAKKAICNVLGIPLIGGKQKKDETVLDAVVRQVFTRIKPTQLTKPLDLRTRPDLIVGASVQVKACRRNSGFGAPRENWTNPNIYVSGIARINLDTGVVDKDATLESPDAGILALPHKTPEMTMPEMAMFRSIIPDEVQPRLPSEVLRQHFRNINDLGHPKGFDALLNATILLSLIRLEIAGSDIGNAIVREFPLFPALPMEGTESGATNQGKTLILMSLAKALVPALSAPVSMSLQTDAPAQRMVSYTLRVLGIGVLDEFILPKANSGHFLDQRGLQSLSTGGKAAPGEAYSNNDGVSLKYPLFIAAKFFENIPDLVDRSFAIFLDKLVVGNSCSDDELADIKSGKLSWLLRLSALRWIQANQFIKQVNEAPLAQKIWRHDGHGSTALLLNADANEIRGYRDAMALQIRQQDQSAEDSGLKASIGATKGFNPKYYWETCLTPVLTELARQCEAGGKPRLVEALKDLVTSYGQRDFKRELNQMREETAAQRLGEQLANGEFQRAESNGESWTMKLVDKDHSELWNASRSHKVPHVFVTHTPGGAPQKTSPELLKKWIGQDFMGGTAAGGK